MLLEPIFPFDSFINYIIAFWVSTAFIFINSSSDIYSMRCYISRNVLRLTSKFDSNSDLIR